MQLIYFQPLQLISLICVSTVQLFVLILDPILFSMLDMKYWCFLIFHSVAFATTRHVSPVGLFYGQFHTQGLNAYQGQGNNLYPRGIVLENQVNIRQLTRTKLVVLQ